MRIKHIRCGICHDWHLYGRPCHSCGAYRLVVNRQVRYYNRSFVQVVRGEVMRFEDMIFQSHSQELDEPKNESTRVRTARAILVENGLPSIPGQKGA